MPHEPSHVRGRRETMQAKEQERASRAAEVWEGVEAERRTLDARTARLRAMRLAGEAGTAS